MSDQSIAQRPAHQSRVLAERLDLAYKVDRLKAFVAAPAFNDLHPSERVLLTQQLDFMKSYLFTLDRRIERFETETA